MIKRDLKIVKSDIENNFEDFKVTSLKALDEGVDSKAYLVNNTFVFRFPKHKDVVRQLRVEIRLLPELRKYLEIDIPYFIYVGEQKNGLPFVGYKYIEGKFLKKELFWKLPFKTQKLILRQIAAFLNQVHSFPVKRARHLKTRTVNYKKRFAETEGWFKKNGKKIFGKNTVEFALAAFQELRMLGEDFQYKPTLLYADLHPWHVILDKEKRKIVGIIDFGDVEIGDPDYEFLRIYDQYGRKFLSELLKEMNHEDPERIWRKVKWLSKVNMLEDVITGIRRNDPSWLSWAKARLEKAVKKETKGKVL